MSNTDRWDIGTSSGSLFEALDELQTAMCQDPEAAIDQTITIPEAVTRRPASRPTPRPARQRVATSPPAQAPAPAAPIPSVVDRIASMPRFRSSTDVAHPTGEAWLSPAQRQFCERPPV